MNLYLVNISGLHAWNADNHLHEPQGGKEKVQIKPTLSLRPNTITFPLACSLRKRHSTKFCPLSPGKLMLRLATVGLAAPARMWGSVW